MLALITSLTLGLASPADAAKKPDETASPVPVEPAKKPDDSKPTSSTDPAKKPGDSKPTAPTAPAKKPDDTSAAGSAAPSKKPDDAGATGSAAPAKKPDASKGPPPVAPAKPSAAPSTQAPAKPPAGDPQGPKGEPGLEIRPGKLRLQALKAERQLRRAERAAESDARRREAQEALEILKAEHDGKPLPSKAKPVAEGPKQPDSTGQSTTPTATHAAVDPKQTETAVDKAERIAEAAEAEAKKSEIDAADAAKESKAKSDEAKQLRAEATAKHEAATKANKDVRDAFTAVQAASEEFGKAPRDKRAAAEAKETAARATFKTKVGEADAAEAADKDAEKKATDAAKAAEELAADAVDKTKDAEVARAKADKARAKAKLLAEEAEIEVDCDSLKEPFGKVTGRRKFYAKHRRELRRCARQHMNARIERQIESERRTFRGAMREGRMARCATAVCWGPSGKWALEPLVELPVGRSFSAPRSSLARYLTTNEVQVAFNAGLRVWLWWDWISFSTYMSKVLASGNDTITTTSSGFAFPASQIRRPAPGFGIGLFGDMLWLSVDYDQLRNGNAGSARAPEFLPNEIVSHAVTFTIAIAPVAGIRNGIGTLAERNRKKKEEAVNDAESRRDKDDEPDPAPTDPVTPAPSTTTPAPTGTDAPAPSTTTPAPTGTVAPAPSTATPAPTGTVTPAPSTR